MIRSRVTIIDVAQVAGVSKSTVANVLNASPAVPIQEGTRQRVLEAVARLGYRKNALAAAFSSGRTNTIGVLLPRQHPDEESPRVARQFAQELFAAVFAAACAADLRVTSIPNWERASTVQTLSDRRVDGLIVASLRSRDLALSIYESGIPCVEISSGFGSHLVHPDNEGGAAQAIDHLARLGHRRIAHYRGPLGEYYASERRSEGFRDACIAHGFPVRECPVLLTRAEVTAHLGMPPRRRPTAIFAFDDAQGREVYEIAESQGLRVPRDLSVVGFDNSLVAELIRPGLTTVDTALEAQARCAVAHLRTLWDQEYSGLPLPGGPDGRIVTPTRIPTHLVVRQSTTFAP